MRKIAIALLMILAAAGGYCQDAAAPHSKAEVLARWQKGRPIFRDWQNMEVYADLNSTPAIGQPKTAYLEDGLRMLNFIRYLVGMEDDVVLDKELNRRAQILTAINTMNDFNTHDPEKPAAMPKSLFDIGFAAGHKCNLQYLVSDEWVHPNAIRSQMEVWGSPFPFLAQVRRYALARMTLDCMADSDYRNVAKIQHRRNFMRPQLEKTGYGYLDVYEEVPMDDDEIAETVGEKPEGGLPPYRSYLRQYDANFVLDEGKETIPDFEYLAWPSPGYFPLQFFKYGARLYPWSVSLNPNKYAEPVESAIKVVISSAKGSYKVALGADDKLGAYGMIGDFDLEGGRLKPFLHVAPQTAHWLPAIHFFPGEGRFPEPVAGDRYRVAIQGLKDKKGKPATISYWVEFLDLPNSEWLLKPDFPD